MQYDLQHDLSHPVDESGCDSGAIERRHSDHPSNGLRPENKTSSHLPPVSIRDGAGLLRLLEGSFTR